MNDIEHLPKGLLTIPEVAQQFGVTDATAYRWARSGELPSVRLGNTVRVPSKLLVDKLARSRVERLP